MVEKTEWIVSSNNELSWSRDFGNGAQNEVEEWIGSSQKSGSSIKNPKCFGMKMHIYQC